MTWMGIYDIKRCGCKQQIWNTEINVLYLLLYILVKKNHGKNKKYETSKKLQCGRRINKNWF